MKLIQFAKSVIGPLSAMLFLVGCGSGGEGTLQSDSIAPPSAARVSAESTPAGSPKSCLAGRAKESWHNRKLSFRGTEQELTARAAEVSAREVGLPLTSRFNILAGGLRNIATTMGAIEPICGNWCGAARIYKKDDPNTVDELDTACRKHDFCARATGRPSCLCDQELADEILRDRNLVSLSENEKSVVMYLQGSPCFGGCKRIENVQVCSR